MTGASRLATLRREAGHTQRSMVDEIAREAARLGIRASVSVRHLRRWENERPPPLPHPDQQAVLEAIFGLPLSELGFEVPSHRQHDRDVRRREFFTSSGSVAAAAVLPDLTGARVGMADVRRLQAGLGELFALDHRRGGIPAQARACALEQQITRTLDSSVITGRVGRALHTMAAELACHRAWFSYDGPAGEARAACMEAFAAAQLVGNELLQVRALNSLSLVAADAGRRWEARSAVERASSLARRAGAGPTVHLVVALREANAATHAGDLTAARRALSRTMSYQGRVDRDQEVPRWARFAGPVEVDYAIAAWYRRAGKPSRAVPFLRAAVNGLDGDYTRNTAWYRARLAQTLLEASEVDEASAEMTRVLDTCGHVSSGRLRQRFAGFAGAAVRTGSPTVHDPVDRIRDLLRAAP